MFALVMITRKLPREGRVGYVICEVYKILLNYLTFVLFLYLKRYVIGILKVF